MINGAYMPSAPKISGSGCCRSRPNAGVIFDRQGRLLVDSRRFYNVILSREVSRERPNKLIGPLSEGLEIDPDLLRERFDLIKSPAAFEYIKVKESDHVTTSRGLKPIRSNSPNYGSKSSRSAATRITDCWRTSSATSARSAPSN